MTPAQEKLLRSVETKLTRLLLLHEQESKGVWVSGKELGKHITVPLLTVRRRGLVENRISAGGGVEYNVNSIPDIYKKQP